MNHAAQTQEGVNPAAQTQMVIALKIKIAMLDLRVAAGTDLPEERLLLAVIDQGLRDAVPAAEVGPEKVYDDPRLKIHRCAEAYFRGPIFSRHIALLGIDWGYALRILDEHLPFIQTARAA